jgi:hypothetical protein
MTKKLVGSSKHNNYLYIIFLGPISPFPSSEPLTQNPDQIRILEATLLKTAWCFAIFLKKELGDKIDSF